MTLAEIIAATRVRATDEVVPYLWSDPEIIGYTNDAQREACRRARLLTDSTANAVCNINLAANRSTYTLNQAVLFITRAKLTTEAMPLRPVSYKDLDCHRPGWEEETGTPTHYVKDMDTGKFRPYPTPDASGTVKLVVTRLPLCDMSISSDEPEISQRLHDSLIFWNLYRMYSKPDVDTQNKVKAAEYLAFFEQEFGKKSSAIDEAWIEREQGYTPEEGVF